MTTRPAQVAGARRRADADGIEVLFTQFVDMHVKPETKLVPTSNREGIEVRVIDMLAKTG